MPQNRIQFQKGLSEVAFHELYGTEELCIAAVERMRWPDGFVCPGCDHDDAHRLERRDLLQCALCRRQVSVTAGTIFDSTKLPLTVWFRAMYHLTSSKNGVSALELSRRLRVSWRTAWSLSHKLSDVMRQRDEADTFTQRVEIDDVYLGGERPAREGHAGRGADGKTPFLAAVETDHAGRPLRIAMRIVPGFTSEAVAAFAKGKFDPSCEVISDGLACFGAVIEAGCSHTVSISGGGRKAVEKPCFRWVNTALGNIKSAIVGTYRHISPKHAQRYLAGFEYRFNRRHDLAGMLDRLAWAAVRTEPVPIRVLKETG